jgi:hypothetical protein
MRHYLTNLWTNFYVKKQIVYQGSNIWYSVIIHINLVQIRPNSLGRTKYCSYLIYTKHIQTRPLNAVHNSSRKIQIIKKMSHKCGLYYTPFSIISDDCDVTIWSITLELSISLLEASFVLLEDIYSGFNSKITIVACLQYRPLISKAVIKHSYIANLKVGPLH